MAAPLPRKLHTLRLEDRTTPSAFPVGPEFRLNTFTTSDQNNAAIAMDADGDFVVAWESQGQDGSDSGIYAQRYSATGAPVGGEFRVNTTTTGFQRAPSVAMDTDGDFVVVWSGPGVGDSAGIFAQRYSSAGTALGGEFLVNSGTTGGQAFAEVAMGAAGNFVVFWGTGTLTGSKAYRRFDASGSPLDAADVPVASFATQVGSGDHAVAADAAGNFVVAWHAAPFGMNAAIYARKFTFAGVPLAAEFTVNTMITEPEGAPSVAMDADGDFVVAWQYNNFQSGSVFARKYDSAGTPITGEFQVNTFTTQDQGDPEVAIDADGDFVVTWTDGEQEGGNGSGVYARCYTAAAVAVGGEFHVNTTTTFNQGNPVVASKADGDFVIVWNSNTGDGSLSNVVGQRYSKTAGVASVRVNDGSVQRSRVTSLTVTFSTTVTFAGAVGSAFTLTRSGGGTVTFAATASVVGGVTVVTLGTFSGAEAEFGSLRDGRYSLTALASEISAGGTALDGDGNGTPGGNFTFGDAQGLFRFYGDMNADRRVDISDFGFFSLAYLTPANYNAALDFNADGRIDIADFGQFSVRFFTRLP